MSNLSSHRINGAPDPDEEKAILAALEMLLKEEKATLAVSQWKLAGRSDSLGAGAWDMRRSLAEESWGRGASMSWSSAAPSLRVGRGDAK